MPSFFDSWLPFIYLYSVGGIFFITGLVIAVKSKSLNKEIPRHRRWFWLLIGGYIFFFVIHAILITAALYW